MEAKESLPPATEPSPVGKEEQSKINKKEPGDVVQEGAAQAKPLVKKRGLTANRNKAAKGNSLVLTKKRKMIEMLEKKKRKKRKQN